MESNMRSFKFIVIAILLSLSSCSKEPPTRPQPNRHQEAVKIQLINEIHQRGNLGEPLENPNTIDYDGRVLESNHFLTFSDASTDEVRIDFASLAEISLSIYTRRYVEGKSYCFRSMDQRIHKRVDSYDELKKRGFGSCRDIGCHWPVNQN